MKSNVGETLASGLAAVVMSNPPDPCDFLAKWLLNYVDTVKQKELDRKTLAEQTKKDEAARLTAAAAYEQQLAAKQEKMNKESRTHSEIKEMLSSAKDTEGLLEAFVERIHKATGAASVYVGRVQSDENIKYIAATPQDQQFLVGKVLEKGSEDDEIERKTPPTYNLFVEEEPEDEPDMDDDDEESGVVREPPPPTVKSVMVSNVLMGPMSDAVHFWGLQKMGCYYAVKINYKATLNDETLEAAASKEDDIEEEERKKRFTGDADDNDSTDQASESKAETETGTPLASARSVSAEEKAAQEQAQAEAKAIAAEQYLLSQLQLKEETYALCLDTLGQSRRFTPKQMAFVNTYSLQLIETLERIDRAFFKDERKRRRELKKFNASWFERRNQDGDEEEQQDAAAKLLKQGKPTTEEDIKFFLRQNVIGTSLRRMMLEMRNFEVLRGPISVCKAALNLLGYTDDQLVDATGQISWRKVRVHFTDDLISKVRSLNPRDLEEIKKLPENAQPAALEAVCDNLNLEDLKDLNAVLAELYGFVQDSIALIRRAEQEERDAEEARRIAAEEAEAERLAEEERLRQEELENAARDEEDSAESARDSSAD